MAKFNVYGSIRIDVSAVIEAATKEEAIEKAKEIGFYTESGMKSVFVDEEIDDVVDINMEVPDGTEIEYCDAEEIDETEDLAEELLEMDEEEYKKAIENSAKKMKDMM